MQEALLSLHHKTTATEFPPNLGHIGQFFNSPGWLRVYRKHPTQKHWWELKLSPRPPSANHTDQTSRQLACSPAPQASLSPSLPGSYCSGNNGMPSRLDSLALNKVAGSIISKMAVCLHILLIDFPLTFAQAAQVSPNPSPCSANTGQMERDTLSQLLAHTFIIRSGPSSFLLATSPNQSFQPPLLPERTLPPSGA
uniref:Uncharacterized protein n=1 Tax=Mus spicilegus TaxID=10103 RepID=A0A8C6GU94_MUSSI